MIADDLATSRARGFAPLGTPHLGLKGLNPRGNAKEDRDRVRFTVRDAISSACRERLEAIELFARR